MSSIRLVVPGGLNTDIIAQGVPRLLSSGELGAGGTFHVGPGGKSRNIAQMTSVFMGGQGVAMIGVTTEDDMGLWKVPIDALHQAGVDTTHVSFLSKEEAQGRYPGIAIIPVDQDGKNQIYLLPGVNDDLTPERIDAASELFSEGRVLVMSLEIPPETATHVIHKAHDAGMTVILDPGGINSAKDVEHLIDQKITLLKPNEHEAKMITGVNIIDFQSATRAAERIQAKGVANVMITHGAYGAYVFTSDESKHIKIPQLNLEGDSDETGCGDQTTAVLAALLGEGCSIIDSAEQAVKAGTMQYFRVGIQPVTREEFGSL